MPTTRKALLISYAGVKGDEHFCPGVYQDIRNYRRLMESAHGGYWERTDIHHLDEPTAVQVRAAVKSLSDFEYSLIAFAGHGFYSTIDRATVLRLRPGNEQISSVELRDGASKRTIILDCCREKHAESALGFEKRALAATAESYQFKRQANAMRCRERFLSDVRGASEAVVQMEGCSPGQTAGDDGQTGGHYTSRLINFADEWANATAEHLAHPLDASCSVVKAHDGAAASLHLRPGKTQTPTIDKPRTTLNYFPFAVFAS